MSTMIATMFIYNGENMVIPFWYIFRLNNFPCKLRMIQIESIIYHCHNNPSISLCHIPSFVSIDCIKIPRLVFIFKISLRWYIR